MRRTISLDSPVLMSDDDFVVVANKRDLDSTMANRTFKAPSSSSSECGESDISDCSEHSDNEVDTVPDTQPLMSMTTGIDAQVPTTTIASSPSAVKRSSWKVFYSMAIIILLLNQSLLFFFNFHLFTAMRLSVERIVKVTKWLKSGTPQLPSNPVAFLAETGDSKGQNTSLMVIAPGALQKNAPKSLIKVQVPLSTCDLFWEMTKNKSHQSPGNETLAWLPSPLPRSHTSSDMKAALVPITYQRVLWGEDTWQEVEGVLDNLLLALCRWGYRPGALIVSSLVLEKSSLIYYKVSDVVDSFYALLP